MSTRFHTIYGTATGTPFTMLMKELTDQEWQDAVDIVAGHDGLAVAGRPSVGWLVGIVDEDGKIEHSNHVGVGDLEDRIFDMAIDQRWIDEDTSFEPDDRMGYPKAVDLAQFDPWSLGYCFQMAAFGEEIVS